MTFMFFFVTQLVKVRRVSGVPRAAPRRLTSVHSTAVQTRDVAATLAFVKKVYPGALVKNYQFWTPAMIVNLRYDSRAVSVRCN